jgi:hypothetical protein
MSGARHKVNQLEFVGSLVDGAAGNRTSASFRRKNSHRPVVSALALHADHWLDTRDQLCQTRLNCTFNDEASRPCRLRALPLQFHSSGRDERACRTLSVKVKIHESAAESVLLHLAGIVRDVIEQLEFGSWE